MMWNSSGMEMIVIIIFLIGFFVGMHYGERSN